jgi:serine/threonine protein kinase
LVMELLEINLHTFLSTQNLDHQSKLNLSIDTAEGLHQFHSKNIIHGNLRARNIVLDVNLIAKIADFGISVESSDMDCRCSPSNTPIVDELESKGNPFWQPLSFKTNKVYTQSFDIYSFGMLLYQIWYRSVPYGTLSNQEFHLALEKNVFPDMSNKSE